MTLIKILSSSCKNCLINVGKKWTLQMSIPQYLVLVLKLTPINTVSLNTVFLNPQNQCYPGNTCTWYISASPCNKIMEPAVFDIGRMPVCWPNMFILCFLVLLCWTGSLTTSNHHKSRGTWTVNVLPWVPVKASLSEKYRVIHQKLQKFLHLQWLLLNTHTLYLGPFKQVLLFLSPYTSFCPS